MFNKETLTEMFDKPAGKVRVKLSKGDWHEGEIIGHDHLTDGIVIGVKKTSLGVTLPKGQKYISIFHARPNKVTYL